MMKSGNGQLRYGLSGLCLVGLLLAGYGTTASAQIQDFAVVDTTPLLRFGPKDPVNGYPIWVEAVDTRPGALPGDTIVLQLCEDVNLVTPPLVIDPLTGAAITPCPACVDPLLDLPNPNLPQSFPDNYPDEHFYYLNESIMIEVDNTRSILTMGLEGAFDGLGAVVDGEQLVFARYRMRIDNATPGQLYQITYPYGVTYAEAENDQAGAAISNINFTNDIFLWKGVPLRTPLDSIMGSFVTASNPPPAAGVSPAVDPATGLALGPANLFTYFNDFCGGGPVEGSPFGTNFFSVIGPNAGMLLSTGNTQPSVNQCDPLDPQMDAAFAAYDAYVIANVDSLAAPLARIPANCVRSDEFVGLAKQATKLGVQVDRATYNRSLVAGANSTQINVWASSFENQSIELSIAGIAAPIPMCGDGTGNYFAHALLPSTFIPPATVTVTNVSDNPPTITTHALSANVEIKQATVNLSSNTLAIAAFVADPTQSAASLSLGTSALTADPADPTLGTSTTTLAADPVCGVVPPLSVTITSLQGGTATLATKIVGNIPSVLAAAGGTVIVSKGSVVNLDGNASIGLGLTYDWAQTGGANITLDPLWDPTSSTPSFTFPSADELITLVLTVTDSVTLASSTDTAIVTNTVVSVAGADQNLAAFPDAGVALNASASQGAGLSYSWAQVATDTLASPQCVGQTLDGAATVAIDPVDPSLATLSMPIEGGCVTLELTVSGPGGTATDSITVKAPVGAPVANAGTDIVVFASEMVQLDASASSGIINAGGFSWTQTAGTPVDLGTLTATGLVIDPLGPPNISMPAFVFPAAPETLTFQVVVTGPGGSSTAIVNVIVDDPGTADTLTPGRARYTENKERFVVDGTSSIPGPGHSVTCWLGSPTTGQLIGTGAVDAIADWKVDTIGGVNPCLVDPGVDPTDCGAGAPTIQIHCISTLGGTTIFDWEPK